MRRTLLCTLMAVLMVLGLVAASPAQVPAPALWDDSVGFTKDRFAPERAAIEAIRRESFPRLGTVYEVLGTATPNYNCIAWSLEITTEWVWPGMSLAAFDQLNARYGYRRLDRLDYRVEPGVDKIVLYGSWKDGEFQATHQARQHRDGTWTSKLGALALIKHGTPEALSGPSYGQPAAVYYRRNRAPQDQPAATPGGASARTMRVPFTRWEYARDERGLPGYFAKEGVTWVEVKGGEFFARFREVERTSEYVELYNEGRGMWLRLHADKALWRQPQTPWFALPFSGVAR